MRKLSLLAVVSLILINSSIAQFRKYSNEFLQIGVGARSLGMSGAVISTTNDITSGYWNPAGLANLDSKAQIGLMHAEYFAGIAKYDFGSFSTRIDSNSSVGFSVIRFGVDDIPNTIELIDANGVVDYNRISTFSIADYAFLGSYARKLKLPGLTVGANAKIIHRTIGKFGRSWGFGLDAGMQYKYKKWNFGLMARDVTTTINAWNYTLDDKTKEIFTQTGNEIPSSSMEMTAPKVILGAAFKEQLVKKVYIVAEANFDLTFDGYRNVLIKTKGFNVDPKLGVELSYDNLVFLRGGIGNIQKATEITGKEVTIYQPNFGVGIRFKGVALDYALTDIGDKSVALYSNIFSLKIDINRKLTPNK
jgi:hypothetical protein